MKSIRRIRKYPAGYYDAPTQENLNKYGITLDQWRAYTNAGSDISDQEVWGATRLGLQGNSLANFLLGQTFDWYDHSFVQVSTRITT